MLLVANHRLGQALVLLMPPLTGRRAESPGLTGRLDWPQGPAVNPSRRPGSLADALKFMLHFPLVAMLVPTVFIIFLMLPLLVLLLYVLFTTLPPLVRARPKPQLCW